MPCPQRVCVWGEGGWFELWHIPSWNTISRRPGPSKFESQLNCELVQLRPGSGAPRCEPNYLSIKRGQQKCILKLHTHVRTHTHSLTRLSQSCIRFVFVTDLCARQMQKAKTATRNTGGCYSIPPSLSLSALVRCVTQISPAGKTSLLIHNSIGARLLLACDLTSIFPCCLLLLLLFPLSLSLAYFPV